MKVKLELELEVDQEMGMPDYIVLDLIEEYVRQAIYDNDMIEEVSELEVWRSRDG